MPFRRFCIVGSIQFDGFKPGNCGLVVRLGTVKMANLPVEVRCSGPHAKYNKSATKKFTQMSNSLRLSAAFLEHVEVYI
uniref:Uncharacterized protein n=1 Tax=Arion vulgaris TaxID=1028688 RepID=A0A0B7B5G7_9EUPU